MKKVVLATLAFVLVSTVAASAASLAPLDAFKAQAITWASDIGIIAFIGGIAALAFAHDHMTQLMGSVTRIVLVVALLTMGVAWLAGLGITTTAGAWLR